MEKEARVDEFLRRIRKPVENVPDSAIDFGTFDRMKTAFIGIPEDLENLRRNQGKLGYTAQNMMSDLSKAAIEASQRGDEQEAAQLENEMAKLVSGFINISEQGELAETGNRFSRTIWQEKLEADLFRVIWPVITGKEDEIRKLPSWCNYQNDGCNVQAFMYGYLDVVPELGKALSDELAKDEMTTELEFRLIQRYLVIADSITLALSQFRHTPGYVINNAFGHWAAFTSKLRTAYGTIAHVRRDYSLRRSVQRMHEALLNAIKEDNRTTLEALDLLKSA